MKNKKNNKGFTLVELLVVIAIIGILAVVAVPALFKNIEKGKIADLEADISAMRSAALSIYADTSEYPTTDAQMLEELEGLSKPFNATYTLGTEKAPDTLTLSIKPPVGSEISEDGFAKLQKDLGKDVVPFNKPGAPADENKPAVEASYDPKLAIKINLINN